jgi:hypothetical protein
LPLPASLAEYIFTVHLPEQVVMTDRWTRRSSSLTKAHFAEKPSVLRQEVLNSVEADLIQARERAEAIEEPLLAYLIDMAIAEVAEVRATASSHEDSLSQ